MGDTIYQFIWWRCNGIIGHGEYALGISVTAIPSVLVARIDKLPVAQIRPLAKRAPWYQHNAADYGIGVLFTLTEARLYKPITKHNIMRIGPNGIYFNLVRTRTSLKLGFQTDPS
jgi:hypothetical protein